MAQQRARIYTGLSFSRETATIQNVIPGSPAAQAGLNYGQEILAVGGWRTSCADDIQQRFADHQVGQVVEVLATDRGRVFHCQVQPAENPLRAIRFLPAVAPAPAQKLAFQAWTGQTLPPPIKGRA